MAKRSKTNATEQDPLAAKIEYETRVAPSWASFLGELDDVQRQALIRAKLLRPDGRTPIATTYRNRENGAIKTKINMATLQELLALDPTKDHRWTEWIINEAGGGTAAKAKSTEAVNTALRAYNLDMKKQVEQGKKKQSELDAELEGYRETLTDLLESGDEDALMLAKDTFGFAYDFPGHNNRYGNVRTACQRFFELYQDGIKLNRQLQNNGEDTVPWSPDTIKSLSEMVSASTLMARRLSAVQAERDVRVGEWPDPTNAGWAGLGAKGRRQWKQRPSWQKHKTVYDDDYVTIVVPLTYAAAVEYGSDSWALSNKTTFRSILRDPSSVRDNPWTTQGVQRGAIHALLTFNVPTPATLTRDDTYVHGTAGMQRLLVRADTKSSSVRNMTFTTTDGRSFDFDAVVRMLRSEVDRPTEPNPDDAGIPIDRGANVYKTDKEANEVVRRFAKACGALTLWIKKHLPDAGYVSDPLAVR